MFDEPSAKPDILATAGTHLVKSGIKLCTKGQTCYRSGVGKLLYFRKRSCPEIANNMHELTHFMLKAFPNSEKGMERAMQHVLSFPNNGVVMQPEGHCVAPTQLAVMSVCRHTATPINPTGMCGSRH